MFLYHPETWRVVIKRNDGTYGLQGGEPGPDRSADYRLCIINTANPRRDDTEWQPKWVGGFNLGRSC